MRFMLLICHDSSFTERTVKVAFQLLGGAPQTERDAARFSSADGQFNIRDLSRGRLESKC